MTYADSVQKMNEYRMQIASLREELHKVQADIEPQEVSDYTFQTPDGAVALSDLFGDKDDLIVIHNMGNSCSYCTLWADGYNGVYPHLADRAAFVISSPDSPDAQAHFARSRGWTFPMVSHQGTTFAEDMGYVGEYGWMPGVSVFRRENGRILRVSDTHCGPGDDFCSVWHFLGMLPAGPDGWQPKFKYA